MKQQYSNIRRAMYKAVLLLSVYCLHLVFFQAAMASSLAPAKYFQTYLSHKADHSKGKPSPASFYIKFIKHANSNGERPTLSPVHLLVSTLQVHMPVVAHEGPAVSQGPASSHLPQDAFRIYQRVRAILI